MSGQEAAPLDPQLASRVPRLSRHWKLGCWTAFLATALGVLAGIISLNACPAWQQGLLVLLPWMLLATFALAATNTFLAAEWFTTRRNELLRVAKAILNESEKQQRERNNDSPHLVGPSGLQFHGSRLCSPLLRH